MEDFKAGCSSSDHNRGDYTLVETNFGEGVWITVNEDAEKNTCLLSNEDAARLRDWLNAAIPATAQAPVAPAWDGPTREQWEALVAHVGTLATQVDALQIASRSSASRVDALRSDSRNQGMGITRLTDRVGALADRVAALEYATAGQKPLMTRPGGAPYAGIRDR